MQITIITKNKEGRILLSSTRQMSDSEWASRMKARAERRTARMQLRATMTPEAYTALKAEERRRRQEVGGCCGETTKADGTTR